MTYGTLYKQALRRWYPLVSSGYPVPTTTMTVFGKNCPKAVMKAAIAWGRTSGGKWALVAARYRKKK